MSANCAGIVGGQLFRSDDLPYYHRGWTIIAVLMSIALLTVATLITLYWRSNRMHVGSSNTAIVLGSRQETYSAEHEAPLYTRQRRTQPYNF